MIDADPLRRVRCSVCGHSFVSGEADSTEEFNILSEDSPLFLPEAVLESKASEESSRMVAMKNATENAQELIEDLTLSYNKVRQANITREMVEIASGAQAR